MHRNAAENSIEDGPAGPGRQGPGSAGSWLPGLGHLGPGRPGLGHPGPGRPDPAAIRARALRPLVWATGIAAALLLALAIGAPSWTGGDMRAALLPGLPAAMLVLLAALSRTPARARVAMALATTTSGFLCLATMGSLTALGGLDPATRAPVLFQLGCFVVGALHLGVAAPSWRRTNEVGDGADELLRMYEEL